LNIPAADDRSDDLRQIVAMGGGGFSMEPENPLLDLYVLEQSRKQIPRICFVPADGSANDYVVRFYSAFTKLPCSPSHLSLFRPPTADLESFLLEKDIVYIGGGNTRSMLALWREWKLDDILRRAWIEGVLLCGLSAGSICWFEQGVTDSIPGRLTPLQCLGFVPGSNCPHYDGEPERRPAYQKLIRERLLVGGYAADDGVALHFVGTQLSHIVSSRATAMAYRVGVDESGDAIEQPLSPRYLGREESIEHSAYSPED
jgi:peptidase E